MKIGIAGLHEIDGLWPLIRDPIALSIRRGGAAAETLTPGHIWQMARSGRVFVIVAWDDAGTIRFASAWAFEGFDFRCLAMAGIGMRDWLLPIKDWISDLAKANGAQWLVAAGRHGWGRVFRDAEKIDDDWRLKL